MSTRNYLLSGILQKFYFMLNMGMIGFLVAGALLAARPVQAAVNDTCTTNADGDWASSSIWDCGRVPLSTDDAVIAHEVSLTTVQAVHSITVDAFGILRFDAPVNLTIHGDLSVDPQGIFDPGNDIDSTGGTVVLGTGSNTITTNGEFVDFYNLTKIASGAGEMLLVDPQVEEHGGIHILNSLSLSGLNGSTFLQLGSTVPGSQWGIFSEWITDVNFVDVIDSNNIGDEITVAVGHDAGNNTNWDFSTSLIPTSVSLSTSSNPIIVGNPVTFTATISPAGASSGEVEFYLDDSPIAGCDHQPVSLVAGIPTATCTLTDLAVGSYDISAEYSGNEEYSGSDSPELTQVVDMIKTYLPIVSQ